MTTRQPSLSGSALGELEGDLLDAFLSFLADQLGLSWGLLLGLVLPTLLLLLAGSVLTVWLWRRGTKVPSALGPDHFVGRTVTVDHAEGTRGQAFVDGSWWSVRSPGVPLRAGQEVRVQSVDGLTLVVEHPTADESHEEEDA